MSDYSKIYKELYEIFKYMPKEEIKKLPKQFLQRITDYMDNSYEYKVTHISDFQNQNMLRETRAILAVLYRDYWASEEEKAKIKKQEQLEYMQEEEEKSKKYDTDIFANKKQIHNNISIEQEAEKALISYKEGFFKKIIKKIISFFKK